MQQKMIALGHTNFFYILALMRKIIKMVSNKLL